MRFPVILTCALAAVAAVRADVKLPAIFDNDMLLQRGKQIPIYGKATPGQNVTVAFAGQTVTATADAKGDWCATLQPLSMSAKPQTMTITGKTTITLDNILVGDVWLASGQSNMEMRLREVNDAKKEIAESDYPTIRFFMVKRDISSKPATKTNGKWFTCTPANSGQFSAAAYFFAREIVDRKRVPIAIINSAVGSSACEAWVPQDKLLATPGMPVPPQDLLPKEYTSWAVYDKNLIAAREKDSFKDTGIKEECLPWATAEYDDSDWKLLKVPGNIKQQGYNIDGAVWFRTTIDIPEKDAGKASRLNLSFVSHRSIAYVNGVKVGSNENRGRQWCSHNYTIPKGVTKPGKNQIAVRIVVEVGPGGFYPQYPTKRNVSVGRNVYLLPEKWKFKVEASRKPGTLTRNMPFPYCIPGGLFNAMIAPYTRTPLKGFIWYQGETNAGRPKQHETLFPLLINSWRELWNDANLPFYYVQLASMHKPNVNPNDHGGWGPFRFAQQDTLKVPLTGMAATLDIGDETNVHPKNKQDCGKRLALWAFRDCYGDTYLPVSGPLFKSATIQGNEIIIEFDHVYDGLDIPDGKPLRSFAIAGKDKKYVWAKARIEGDNVIVSSPKVPEPLYVRYAWSNNPQGNLYNRAGLPATSFTTEK